MAGEVRSKCPLPRPKLSRLGRSLSIFHENQRKGVVEKGFMQHQNTFFGAKYG